MKLLTKEQREKLLSNGAKNNAHRAEDGNTEDFAPVVKFFTPWGAATWLISEITEEEEDGSDAIMFGLCDLGMGSPEMGYVSLAELQSVRGPGRLAALGIERDRFWKGTAPLTKYWEAARIKGRIVDTLPAVAPVGTCQHCGASGPVGADCQNCKPMDFAELGRMVFQGAAQ